MATREEAAEESIRSREAALYAEWKRSGRHFEEYASELAGTAFLLFCVVGLVGAFFGANAALLPLVPSTPIRLFLLGLLIGLASAVVAVSPPGKLSGAHLDPAVSAGFWLLGKMHGRDLLGYVVSQMVGAVIGTLLGGLVFGTSARSVQMGSLHPGPHVSLVGTWGGELLGTLVLALAVYLFVSVRTLARWTPAMAAVLLGLLLLADGSYSGAGFNPGRWFGPALCAGVWRFGTAYALAPVFGASFAAAFCRLFLRHPLKLHTAKLFHDARYRSIFREDGAPSKPPEHVSAQARL